MSNLTLFFFNGTAIICDIQLPCFTPSSGDLRMGLMISFCTTSLLNFIVPRIMNGVNQFMLRGVHLCTINAVFHSVAFKHSSSKN